MNYSAHETHTRSAELLSRIADIAAPFGYAEAALIFFFTGNIPMTLLFAGIGRMLQAAHEDLKDHNTFQWPKKRNS